MGAKKSPIDFEKTNRGKSQRPNKILKMFLVLRPRFCFSFLYIGLVKCRHPFLGFPFGATLTKHFHHVHDFNDCRV